MALNEGFFNKETNNTSSNKTLGIDPIDKMAETLTIEGDIPEYSIDGGPVYMITVFRMNDEPYLLMTNPYNVENEDTDARRIDNVRMEICRLGYETVEDCGKNELHAIARSSVLQQYLYKEIYRMEEILDDCNIDMEKLIEEHIIPTDVPYCIETCDFYDCKNYYISIENDVDTIIKSEECDYISGSPFTEALGDNVEALQTIIAASIICKINQLAGTHIQMKNK